MKNAFIHKILTHGSVDTRKYRYRAVDLGYEIEIRRIPLDCLDRTVAPSAWTVVKIIN